MFQILKIKSVGFMTWYQKLKWEVHISAAYHEQVFFLAYERPAILKSHKT